MCAELAFSIASARAIYVPKRFLPFESPSDSARYTCTLVILQQVTVDVSFVQLYKSANGKCLTSVKG